MGCLSSPSLTRLSRLNVCELVTRFVSLPLLRSSNVVRPIDCTVRRPLLPEQSTVTCTQKKRHFNFESYAHRQLDTSLFKVDTSTTSGMCNFYVDCFKTRCFWLDGRSRMANQLFSAPLCNFHSACLSLFTGPTLCTKNI